MTILIKCLFIRSLNIKIRVFSLIHKAEEASVINQCCFICPVFFYNCTDPCIFGISVSFIMLLEKCRFLVESFPFLYWSLLYMCFIPLSLFCDLRSLKSLYCSLIYNSERDIVAPGLLERREILLR